MKNRERLRRVEAHLRALEGTNTVDVQDIVIKQTQPIRIAQAAAEGLTHADIGPAFGRLLPEVLAHLESVGAKPGISAAYYEDQNGTAEEGNIVLHAGFEIGDQDVPDSDRVTVVDLPVLEVASVVHRGAMDGITASWEGPGPVDRRQWLPAGRRLPGALPRVARRRSRPSCHRTPTAHSAITATERADQ